METFLIAVGSLVPLLLILVVIHEFGHYFGLSEDEIENIEERYWRGPRDG